MENTYITNISIDKVRHLEDIKIPLSEEKKKHLILTGKNGSGKTSVLDAIATFLDFVTAALGSDSSKQDDYYVKGENEQEILIETHQSEHGNNVLKWMRAYWLEMLKIKRPVLDGLSLDTFPNIYQINQLFGKGKFVAAYYRADRVFKAIEPKHVEKIELKNEYSVYDNPRNEFVKYLLDLKMQEVLALAGKKDEKAKEIKEWFSKFEDILKDILENQSVHLEFDEEHFKFFICMDGRETFDFNTLSSGYAAVLDIVVDLILRMEKQTNRRFDFSIPGIVLIDEIETHLHLTLQKKIMGLLTAIFPNIQFIISTHSPFILNSMENAVIYDLENRTLVEHGLSNIPYAGIVEGYFKADELSAALKEKYQRYKELVDKSELTDKDFDDIADLELYLNEIPDYLALGLTTEYQRLKQKLRNREDI